MGDVIEINPERSNDFVIDFSRLEYDFMPGFQKEKECFREAKIRGAKDRKGKIIKEYTWPRDPQPGENAYYKWLVQSVDPQTGNYYCERDAKGNPIIGTGAKHIVDQIIRIRTLNGEFLYTLGRLEGYDHIGNKTHVSCARPERYIKINFKFEKIIDDKGHITTQCTGPNGFEEKYSMPFNLKNLRDLAKRRAGDNIPFIAKDEISGKNPQGLPITGSIESRINFFMKDFDYLFNAGYLSKEDKAWNRKISELILSGKASNEEEALELAELEIESKKGSTRIDSKSGVA